MCAKCRAESLAFASLTQNDVALQQPQRRILRAAVHVVKGYDGSPAAFQLRILSIWLPPL